MKVLITGGAGFIGCNTVDRFLRRGDDVIVFDNLSRRGGQSNLEWLRSRHGASSFRLIKSDVRNYDDLKEAVQGQDVVIHLAGQVTVTTSVEDPRSDFEANALGTFNALEAARHSDSNPIFLYASTNKVYGGMEDVPVDEEDTRYVYRDMPYGIPETQPLDFHSPYGNSKGSGDQYTRDYARIYGLRSVVFRQSAIYGPHQFGIEDQGWIAWFIIAVTKGHPITIFGNGKQVRDVLYVDDLIDLYLAAIDNIDRVAGEVFNVGGSIDHTLSVWAEFGPMLERQLGRSIPVKWKDWRPGDQRIAVLDIRKAREQLGWAPKVDVEEGVQRLIDWVTENRALFD